MYARDIMYYVYAYPFRISVHFLVNFFRKSIELILHRCYTFLYVKSSKDRVYEGNFLGSLETLMPKGSALTVTYSTWHLVMKFLWSEVIYQLTFMIKIYLVTLLRHLNVNTVFLLWSVFELLNDKYLAFGMTV